MTVYSVHLTDNGIYISIEVVNLELNDLEILSYLKLDFFEGHTRPQILFQGLNKTEKVNV